MLPFIKTLDDAQVDHILAQAKRILEDIGMELHGPRLRDQLLARGLRMSEDGRVHFPPEIVDQAIADAPGRFLLYSRDGDPYTSLGDNRVHFVPGSSALKILDANAAEPRPATTADFTAYVRLADGLEHIAYLATAFSTNDTADDLADAWRLFLCLINSRKPVVSGAFTENGVPRMAEMMQLFRSDRADLRDRPMAIFTITPTGNFRYSDASCQNLLDCVQSGIPIEITPVTLMGLVAPVTLIEAAIFHTADVLAGLTMAQLIRPGSPVLFGGAPAAFHMRTATAPMAAIEAQQLNMAYVQIAKHLGLPTQAYMALSDSRVLDAQAGAETFSSAILAALAGINSVSGPGLLEYAMVFSLPKLVVDNELCGQALHFVRPSAVSPGADTVALARELLLEQHMMTAEHTLENWREHLFLAGPLIDRQSRDKWARGGSLSLEERALAEVETRLAAYEPIATDAAIVLEMRRVLLAGRDDQASLPETPR